MLLPFNYLVETAVAVSENIVLVLTKAFLCLMVTGINFLAPTGSSYISWRTSSRPFSWKVIHYSNVFTGYTGSLMNCTAFMLAITIVLDQTLLGWIQLLHMFVFSSSHYIIEVSMAESTWKSCNVIDLRFCFVPYVWLIFWWIYLVAFPSKFSLKALRIIFFCCNLDLD